MGKILNKSKFSTMSDFRFNKNHNGKENVNSVILPELADLLSENMSLKEPLISRTLSFTIRSLITLFTEFTEKKTNKCSIPTTQATVLPRAQLKVLPKSDVKKLPVKQKLESRLTLKWNNDRLKSKRKLNTVTSTLLLEKLTLPRT